MRRVVITGAGTVNALARDVRGTFEAFRAGRSGIGPLELPDLERLQIRIGAQIRDWQPEALFAKAKLALYDRFTQFALVAGAEAMDQAGLVLNEALSHRAGVILGSAGGGLTTSDAAYREVYQEGRARVHPFTVPRLMNSAAASHLSMAQGLKGPVFSVASACAGSNHAMGLAFQLIRGGAADVMLCGGAEAMLSFGGLKAWEGLRVMSPTGCRPFSADRDGMVMGEGAAVFVFEELAHARARGAEILAEVAGFGMTADAAEIVLPSAEGAARAMRAALQDAGLRPDEIGYINAHGTATLANDRSESTAIREVFGDSPPPVSSTKSMHGHAMGATGAIELLACLLALREGVLAPTLGHNAPDGECLADVVANQARVAKPRATLSNAFAFGGLNAVLALKAL
ncbi:beta-ketoacyl-[acyl-carrier-protein] synthase family protein [Falsigemmobacter faecalis]|uniref:Nodulation protein E n=1 Tax=Falsigemmobacter faecalis TaxID=2488730 RepID=A0A3P3DQ49_9RHOB|nr:beta-ketoacyl-[acyl-carrier-protein] synthase family protein [Falsigemmobacter faecalis]RRH74758.1 beta-ketoacyl-[acyl-carrier-protein] synthase family protein [Falsigemmobacter faecalis]